MKVAIIGAGFTGLAAASDLEKSGHQVTVYEAASFAGGLAAGFKQPHWDWTIESYYHHWFASDTDMKRWLQELHLDDHLIYSIPKTVAYHKGNFYPLDSIPAIVKFPAFNHQEVIRFGAVTAYLKYLARWQNLEKYTAQSWLTRWYGPKIYQLIWEPLLQGKFGPYAPEVNMAWMWARLKARTQSLGTYRGGFQALVNAVVHLLTSKKVTLHLSTKVNAINKTNSGFTIHTSSTSSNFDACLITTPPTSLPFLLKDIKTSVSAQHTQPHHLGAIMVIYALNKPLSPQKYYWYNLPKNEGFPCLALVEHTNFVSPKHFGGDHIIYAGDYRLPKDPLFAATKNKVIQTFTPVLKTINPNFNASWIKNTWVFRAPFAQPVPPINYSQFLEPIAHTPKGLYIANMSQVYPWDRGTNFAIKLGRQAAALIHRDSKILNPKS